MRLFVQSLCTRIILLAHQEDGVSNGLANLEVATLSLLLENDRFMSEAHALSNLIGNTVATIVLSHSEREWDQAQM